MCKERCGYCGKMVRDKPIFGTLHVCMTDEEREEFDRRERDRFVSAVQKREYQK